MLFNSIEFAVFLPIVVGIYYSLETRLQNFFLVAAGFFFYGWWDWRFCGLLAFSIVLDYACALRMRGEPERAKVYLGLSLCGNLGVLGFFKYFDFFAASCAELLASLGLGGELPLLGVILPVGISFYTFQTLAYTIDVYRGKIEPSRDLLTVALYVSFFPQLVAGPIERPARLLGQFERPRRVDASKIASGAFLILLGLFKKMAIADAVAHRVNVVFSGAADASWVVLLEGAWLFSFQIYCDFSGYSDIARGAARLFGIELMRNFNQPYLAANITDFWRRWHISLSSWLRDYLYIPLGGNRKGIVTTYRNLLLTMILGGLWHGANWTFVVWGALHGVYLSVHKLMLEGWGRVSTAEPTEEISPARLALKRLVTFHLVTAALIVFRASTAASALQYLAGIASFRGGVGAVLRDPYGTLSLLRRTATVAFYGLLVLAVDLPQHRSGRHEAIRAWRRPIRGAAYAGMVLLMILLQPDNETPFIYFQF